MHWPELWLLCESEHWLLGCSEVYTELNIRMYVPASVVIYSCYIHIPTMVPVWLQLEADFHLRTLLHQEKIWKLIVNLNGVPLANTKCLHAISVRLKCKCHIEIQSNFLIIKEFWLHILYWSMSIRQSEYFPYICSVSTKSYVTSPQKDKNITITFRRVFRLHRCLGSAVSLNSH